MNTLIRNLFFILLAPLLFGCNGATITTEIDTSPSTNEQILSMLKETRTNQYFSDESVLLKDITEILDAGRNAPSGRNMQPWYFGAIINQEIIKEISSTMTMVGPLPGFTGTPDEGASMLPPTSSTYPKAGFSDAPAAIAIASTENNSFSAGLACENMLIAATSLGYGTKIVASGAALLNEPENRALLQIPDNMSVIAILLVGNPDPTIDLTADGVTGASERKPLEEISSVIE